MRYLLDTNVVSDMVRHPQGRVAERIAEVGEANICTSIIVASELRYGAAKQGSPRSRQPGDAASTSGRPLPGTEVRPQPDQREGVPSQGWPCHLAARLESVLAALDVLPLEAPADVAYGEIRAQLERDGRPIGANDLLIAAQALILGCTVVTANQSEFGRVPSLRQENWLA